MNLESTFEQEQSDSTGVTQSDSTGVTHISDTSDTESEPRGSSALTSCPPSPSMLGNHDVGGSFLGSTGAGQGRGVVNLGTIPSRSAPPVPTLDQNTGSEASLPTDGYPSSLHEAEAGVGRGYTYSTSTVGSRTPCIE